MSENCCQSLSGIHLSVDQHYRAQQMKYWNHDLPQLLRNPQTEPWSPQDRDSNRDGHRDGHRDGSVYGVPRLYQRPRDREVRRSGALRRQRGRREVVGG